MSTLPEDSRALEILTAIREALPVLPLVPGREPFLETVALLDAIGDDELCGGPVARPDMAACVRSGLLLRADLLHESHGLSQQIHTPEGSYWHGIMHRREPDWSNSKYWFRKVGEHSIFPSLATRASDFVSPNTAGRLAAGGAWDPFRVVDLCEEAVHGDEDALRVDLERLQELEIETLLGHCARGALGG